LPGVKAVAPDKPGLPPALHRFAWLIAAMTVLSEAYSWAMSRFFHQRPPSGGTVNWQDAGSDFLIFRERFFFFRSSHFWDPFALPFTYLAPLGVACWLQYKLLHAAQVRTLALLVLLVAVLHYRYADAGEPA